MLNWTTGHQGDSLKRYPDSISSDHCYVRGRDDMSRAARWAFGPGCALSGLGRGPLHPKDVPDCCADHWDNRLLGPEPLHDLHTYQWPSPIQRPLRSRKSVGPFREQLPNRSLMQIPCPQSLPTIGDQERGSMSPGPYQNDLLVPLLISRCPIFHKPYLALLLILAR